MRAAAKPLAVAVVLILALGVRIYQLDIPFLEPFNNYSRQSMCASVARNFYERGMNLFRPEIDENGTGPALYNVELPLNSYLMAAGYKIAGGVREGVARSVSVGFSLLFLFSLYFLVKRAEDAPAALGALGLAAFSPMAVALSRSLQPDIAMLALGTAGLCLFHAYSRSENLLCLAGSALLLFAAVLIRPYALYFAFPIFFLAWEKEGPYCLRMPRYFFYAIFVALALGWYAYMWKEGQDPGLAYIPYRHSPATAGMSLFDFLAPKNLALPAKAVFLHILTPIGAVFCLLGFFREGKSKSFFVAWLAATVFYLVVVWRTAMIHPYYYLPLLAPLSYFFAQGFRLAWGKAPRKAAPVAAGLLALLVLANVFYYYQKTWTVPADRRTVVEAGRAVDEKTPKGAIVVASYGPSPIQVYYNHRRGWTFDLAAKDDAGLIEELKDRRRQGATHYMTTQLDLLNSHPVFRAWLEKNSAAVAETPEYVIYALNGELR